MTELTEKRILTVAAELAQEAYQAAVSTLMDSDEAVAIAERNGTGIVSARMLNRRAVERVQIVGILNGRATAALRQHVANEVITMAQAEALTLG